MSRLFATTVFVASLTGAAAAEVDSPLDATTAESSATTVVVQAGSPVGAVNSAPSATLVVQPGQAISVQPGQVVVLVVQPTPAATNQPSSSDGGDTRAGGAARSRYSPDTDRTPGLRSFQDEQRFPSER